MPKVFSYSLTRLLPSLGLLLILFHPAWSPSLSAQTKKGKRFQSKVISKRTPGHAVDIDVDVSGGKKLFLVVTDGGNGFSCDWADWAEPRLIKDGKEIKLTELKWQSANSDWGDVNINKNAEGRPLRIAGKEVPYGIGTHANSVIVFDLPEGVTRFKARGGVDNGGTDQQGGNTTSVQFHVYVDKLPKNVVRKTTSRNQGNVVRDPSAAVDNLDVGEGLEAKLFASEPMMLSPTNIDIDHRGRIWVCEVINYRGRNGTRKEGDRILILEDTDGDGKADKQKVYYQGRDVDSAMGICVLGNKVIVSCSPNVFVFTDEDGDDRPDRKELLFTRTGQRQHDHSAHAFLFGPDGRLYWNFGNTGRSVHDKNGKPVIDKLGNTVAANSQPYREGMVFRCDMDGSNFEVLGYNFRNNYEVTIDSFGTLWQSDNDDDGNRGVRINYVMEFGNFGYRDEKTGAGWRSPRTGMSEEVPLRHWHLNDPGVVPNLLQTGAGSPCGICVYEGNLLPKRFHNEVIHCDAGPSVVRAYPVEKDGAGYKATIENILEGSRDRWFRPSDVATAPDGSIIVADWYDPGVGGHRMGDIDKGRLFRVAPPDTKYVVPKFDFKTAEGSIEALKNPALSVRYLAWKSLHEMQTKAEAELLKVFKSDPDPRIRARVLWLLGRIKGKEQHYIDLATKDQNPNIRIVGLRLARMLEKEVVALAEKLAHDPSPQVRRECAIALHGRKSEEVAKVWAELAAQHNGKDRWYLEALGIGARGNWDACLSAYLKKVGEKWDTPAGHNIIWRSRAEVTPEYLQKIIAQESIGRESLPRYFRAFDFQDGPKKDEALIQLAFGNPKGKEERTSYIVAEAVSRLKNFNINKNPKYKKALQRVVEQNKGTEQFVALVTQFNLKDRYPEVLELAQKNPDNQIGVEAITALLAKNQRELISKALEHKKMEVALATIQVLGTSQDGRIQELLLPLVENKKADLSLRRAAVRSLAKVRNGAKQLGNLASRKKLDPQLKEATAAALHQATWRDVKEQANRLFPLPAAKGNQKLPSIAELLRSRGDAKRGLQIFLKAGTCANCHKVNGMGKEVGPDLSEIGNKLSRQAMYESILFPSAAISHNYETYALVLKSGNIVEGVLVSDTAAGVEIKGADAIVRKYKESEIEEKIKKPVSLMPADMAKLMSKQDLVDVVTYLTTLKKSKEAKKTSRLRLDSLDYCRQERMLCVLRLEQSIEVFYPEKRIEKLLP